MDGRVERRGGGIGPVVMVRVGVGVAGWVSVVVGVMAVVVLLLVAVAAARMKVFTIVVVVVARSYVVLMILLMIRRFRGDTFIREIQRSHQRMFFLFLPFFLIIHSCRLSRGFPQPIQEADGVFG